MDAVPPAPFQQPKPLDPRIGAILRVIFYIATSYVALAFIPSLLVSTLGVVVGATIGLFLVGLLANVLTIRIFDRRALAEIGLHSRSGTGRNLLLGIALGGGTAALMLLLPVVLQAAHFAPKPSAAFTWPSLAFYLITLLFGAAGEELLFHGYAFQLLIDRFGAYTTILPVSLIFGLAHGLNPNASYLGLLNTVLWGFLLGYAFLRSRDLWLLIGLHYGWNATLPLFGVNLSGLTIGITRYTYQWDLAPVWSGGAYGPEGGLLTTLFVVALFFVLRRTPVVAQEALIAKRLNDQ